MEPLEGSTANRLSFVPLCWDIHLGEKKVLTMQAALFDNHVSCDFLFYCGVKNVTA